MESLEAFIPQHERWFAQQCFAMLKMHFNALEILLFVLLCIAVPYTGVPRNSVVFTADHKVEWI